MSKVFYSMLSCFAVAIVFTACVDVSSALNCDNIVFEETSGVLNWLGNVTFVVPRTVVSWTIRLEFDQQYTGIGIWVGYISNFGEQRFSVMVNREDTGSLTAGQEFTFRFRINYGRDIPKPALIGLTFEGTEMCV